VVYHVTQLVHIIGMTSALKQRSLGLACICSGTHTHTLTRMCCCLHILLDLSMLPQVAADNAVFGQTGPKVGSFDAGYGSTHMARLVGQKKAREMWFLARLYDAQQALEMGLVNKVRGAAGHMIVAAGSATAAVRGCGGGHAVCLHVSCGVLVACQCLDFIHHRGSKLCWAARNCSCQATRVAAHPGCAW
jgi:hypothetical protein